MVEMDNETSVVADEAAVEHAEPVHTEDLGPSGAEAVEPDAPPMRILTVTVVVIGIFVIGAGIGLAQYLGASTRSQQADKVGNVSAVYQAQKTGDAEKLGSYGFDAETKHFRIPLAEAKAFLAKNPTKVGSKEMWGLDPLTKPEPKQE